MKKSAVTLESLEKNVGSLILNLDKKFDCRFDSLENKVGGLEQKVGGLEQKVGGLEQKVGGLEQKFEGLEQKVDDNTISIKSLEQKVEDNTSSIQFLIENAVMREEMYQAIDDRLDSRLIPMESRLLAAIDGIAKQGQTNDQEITIIRYQNEQLDHRVGKIEKILNIASPV